MNRVYVEAGSWFDYGKIRRWDDRDPITNCGAIGPGQGYAVILTSAGRWVREKWTDIGGASASYQYIEPEDARDFLLREGFESALAELFPETPDEAGPGRPEIGNRVNVFLGDLRPRIDASRAEGESLSEAIRRLISAGLER